MGNKLNCHGEKNSSRQIITENEISLLLANTEMDREQIIDFHANFLSDCPSGILTKKEFTKMFKQLHIAEANKNKADKFTEYVFK
jgi:Ca2+-binding EF-hand superfamily protein